MPATKKAEISSLDRPSLGTGILSAVGNTPLIRLDRVFPANRFEFYAKLEMSNPGGSIKDRAALSMLREGMASGRIGPRTTIVESSSGNLGIGLAQQCLYLGLRFICVVDLRTTAANRVILEAFGAELQVVDRPDEPGGDLLTARINRAKQLCASIEDSFWVNQYENLGNPRAHTQTMREIDEALDGGIDYLFLTTSTCGTLRGCSEYVKARGLPTKVVAVDAAGSVIFGHKPAQRLIPGHGAGRMPAHYRSGLEDLHVHVTDLDCVRGCHRLLRSEAIFAGGSSGGLISAVGKIESQIPAGATCVGILCDRGERYLDTIYSDEWIGEHFAGFAAQLATAKGASPVAASRFAAGGRA